jgi:hypothetical protein
MRWLALTTVLLAASAALVLGIYERDREASAWLPPGPTIAHHDAMAVAAAIGGTCPRDCAVRLLGHPDTNHWTERIQIPTVTECVDINVSTFATDDSHGLSGVRTVACEDAAAGRGGSG